MSPTATSTQLELNRILDADQESVFRAWSDPNAIRAWFGPSDEYEVVVHEWDFRLGGLYRVEMRHQGGNVHIVGGTFRQIEPTHRLSFSWVWEEHPEMETLVTVSLDSAEQGTRLTLLHEGFPDEPVRDDHEKGWSGSFERLVRLLA